MDVEVHSSISARDLKKEVAASLRANELDPKLLYVTARQASLWREVFLRHSPIHGNPDFARIYSDACALAVDGLRAGRVWLVGLGCGTGLKEAQLCAWLRESGHEVEFSAIDVSRELVMEAAGRLAEAGAASERHLVCDLGEIDFLRRWLDAGDRTTPRVFTFFGLVPNLKPPCVAQLLRELLRPGDLLLVSVHLAPMGEGIEEKAAMERILPQYNNPETLAWLRAAIDEWELGSLIGEPQVVAGLLKVIPCVFGIAPWKSYDTFVSFTSRRGHFTDTPFFLFRSFRYTLPLFEELLHEAGVQGELLAITACREEAIWAVRVQEGQPPA